MNEISKIFEFENEFVHDILMTDVSGSGCSDINECSPTNPCGSNSICTNQPGTYQCSCVNGYSWSGSCKKNKYYKIQFVFLDIWNWWICICVKSIVKSVASTISIVLTVNIIYFWARPNQITYPNSNSQNGKWKRLRHSSMCEKLNNNGKCMALLLSLYFIARLLKCIFL